MNKKGLLEQTERNELFQFLGVKIESVEKDKVVLSMEVTPKVHQYVGIMNGGVSLFLCETAASIGAVINADLTKSTPVGIEINANHLRAVSRGVIRIEAKPLSAGRTMSIWSIEITNDRGKLICVSRCSILLRKGAALSAEN
ncbi:MAG: PaaI family thioesterase [Acidobacteriota bacterium]|nr:PaaI family thioesterase [Acidobacteriota bacterium]